MRLTMMSDYAMRVLMYVAQRPERLCTIGEIASAHGISKAHLMKVTHQLGLSGWVETVRGRGGGLRLGRPAEQIVVGAVIRQFEPDFDVVECFSANSGCQLTGACRLSNVFNSALEQFISHLDQHTLADLLPTLLPNPVYPVRFHHNQGAI
ncbi:Rrf2 family transcriptional regulator [Sinimarinibacterium sp. NLF-5-8]|uniref:RrF2 family transcriptional regulator n=1 Tax=Sinimarinibacterium sp. NLF-5-8 TaxID=2698684 RepID=UPI00137BB406|nr:Rrf2 family transcriptional regulator [Sinimarinibacterium sp. NLF-5-8]QHS09309.1 Rrf2 family transcriptional regulator [Sinimarinibacterium sp. NLF-5-8]